MSYKHIATECPTCTTDLPGMTPEAKLAMLPLMAHLYYFPEMGIHATVAEADAKRIGAMPEQAAHFAEAEQAILKHPAFGMYKALTGQAIVQVFERLANDVETKTETLGRLQQRANTLEAHGKDLEKNLVRLSEDLRLAREEIANQKRLLDEIKKAGGKLTKDSQDREAEFKREREEATRRIDESERSLRHYRTLAERRGIQLDEIRKGLAAVHAVLKGNTDG